MRRIGGPLHASARKWGEAELLSRCAGARTAWTPGRAEVVPVRVLPTGARFLHEHVSLPGRALAAGDAWVNRARIWACGRLVGRRGEVTVRARGRGGPEVVQSVAVERHERDHEVGGVADR